MVNLEEIKEALKKVESVYWNSHYDEYLKMPTMNILGEECVTVAKNAPEWLASLIEQIEEMQKTLDAISKYRNWGVANEDHPEIERLNKTIRLLADMALQSLKGEPI